MEAHLETTIWKLKLLNNILGNLTKNSEASKNIVCILYKLVK